MTSAWYRDGGRIGRAVLGLALPVFLASLPARAACVGLAFASLPGAVEWLGGGGGYNVFDPAIRPQAVAFSVRKTSGTCTYFIAAADIDGGTPSNRRLRGSGASLAYNLFTTSQRTNPIRDIPAASANDLVIGAFAAAGAASNTHTYYFDIPPLQLVLPARYQAAIRLRLFHGDLVNNTLVHTLNVVHQANVGRMAEISLGPAGQPFDPLPVPRTLDLGTLDRPRRVGLDMRVRANSGFSVTMQSQNGGVLRHVDASIDAAIPYELTIDGAAIDLAGRRSVPAAVAIGLTGLTGNLYSIAVAAGPADAISGTYRDIISIVVTAK